MFRFEGLEVWQSACDAGDELCEVAGFLEDKRLYRFAEQLHGTALSISNNIAEGSGSISNAEFRNFLNYSRRSIFECASMVAFFCRKEHISTEQKDTLLKDLDILSRKITTFSRTLNSWLSTLRPPPSALSPKP